MTPISAAPVTERRAVTEGRAGLEDQNQDRTRSEFDELLENAKRTGATPTTPSPEANQSATTEVVETAGAPAETDPTTPEPLEIAKAGIEQDADSVDDDASTIGAGPQSDAVAETESVAGADTRGAAVAVADADADADAEARAVAVAGADTAPDAPTVALADPETPPKAEAEAEAETETETVTVKDTDTDAAAGAETETAPNADAAAKNVPAATPREPGPPSDRPPSNTTPVEARHAPIAEGASASLPDAAPQTSGEMTAQATPLVPGPTSAALAGEAGLPTAPSQPLAAAAAKPIPWHCPVPQTLSALPATVTSAIGAGTQRMQIRLAPPELGALEIDVRVKGNEVNLSVRCDTPQAADQIAASLVPLRQSLGEQGLSLAGFQVGGDGPQHERRPQRPQEDGTREQQRSPRGGRTSDSSLDLFA